MGVELLGRSIAWFSWGAWGRCLDIAVAFGWEPAGTAAPTGWDGEWDGSYGSNNYQTVTDPDARALGRALHREIDALEAGEDLTEDQFKALRGANLSLVRELADFALTGSFNIG